MMRIVAKPGKHSLKFTPVAARGSHVHGASRVVRDTTALEAADIRWTGSFRVVDREAPVLEILSAASTAEYVVVRKQGRAPRYFVVKSDELRDPGDHRGSSLGQRVTRFLSSLGVGRKKDGVAPSRFKFNPASKGRAADPWRGRVVQIDTAGNVKAVGIPETPAGPAPGRKYAFGGKAGIEKAHQHRAGDKRRARRSEGPPPGLDSRRARLVARIAGAGEEATEIRRHPSLQPRGLAVPGHLLTVEVDLLRRATDTLTESDGVHLSGLPDDWKWIDIDVRLLSPDVWFEEADETRRIRVRRNQDSTPCIFSGTVSPETKDQSHLDLFASFWYRGRSCGSARRRVPVRPNPSAESPAPAVPRKSRNLAGHGSFSARPAAEPPVLTVKITPVPSRNGKQLLWDMGTSLRNVDALPARMQGMVDLGTSPAAFVDRLLGQTFGRERGRHTLAMTSFGQMLFDISPPAFQDTYWALRSACRERGLDLTIQFICFEPRVPWEMMCPHRGPNGERAGFLFAEHRVARWLGEYEGRLRDRYPHGRIMSVVPRYTGEDRLPAAEEEGALLQSRCGAVRVPGTWKAVKRLLTHEAAQPISILHFAGHGAYDRRKPEASRIHLEGEDDLTALEVRMSGLAAAKGHPLVLFNACEVGSVGHLLTHVAGWADSFLYGDFGGVVAPIWTVYDGDSAETMLELVDRVVGGAVPVSEALRDIRSRSGERSQTFLAYIYYGDVTARMAAPDA